MRLQIEWQQIYEFHAFIKFQTIFISNVIISSTAAAGRGIYINSIDFIIILKEFVRMWLRSMMDRGYAGHSFEPCAFPRFVVFPLCLCNVSIETERNANGLMTLLYIQIVRELVWIDLFSTWWRLLPVWNLSQDKQTKMNSMNGISGWRVK